MTQIKFEYAVRWHADRPDCREIEECSTLERAQGLIEIYPQWDGEILERVVEVGDWRVKK